MITEESSQLTSLELFNAAISIAEHEGVKVRRADKNMSMMRGNTYILSGSDGSIIMEIRLQRVLALCKRRKKADKAQETDNIIPTSKDSSTGRNDIEFLSGYKKPLILIGTVAFCIVGLGLIESHKARSDLARIKEIQSKWEVIVSNTNLSDTSSIEDSMLKLSDLSKRLKINTSHECVRSAGNEMRKMIDLLTSLYQGFINSDYSRATSEIDEIKILKNKLSFTIETCQ